MKVRFYGVRGSIATAGDETRRYGGNTSCVAVEVAGETLIFDAGTGLRKLGADLMKAGPTGITAHLFYSHLHWDHIQGFPFFGPAFVPGNRLHVHAVAPSPACEAHENFDSRAATMELRLADIAAALAAPTDPDPKAGVRAAMASQMQAPNFPVGLEAMRADLTFVDVPAGDVVTVNPFVTVRHTSVDHPNGCVAWRVDAGGKSVVYATDLELAEGEAGAVFHNLVELCRGADLLVFDAMYTPEEYAGIGTFPRRGWGHSTFEMGAAVAEQAGVKQLALFHHDPGHDDAFMDQLGARARTRFAGTVVATEGMEIDLEATGAGAARCTTGVLCLDVAAARALSPGGSAGTSPSHAAAPQAEAAGAGA
jgi:phosphoribosyl 1,2-cyclic phosphodiesterase